VGVRNLRWFRSRRLIPSSSNRCGGVTTGTTVIGDGTTATGDGVTVIGDGVTVTITGTVATGGEAFARPAAAKQKPREKAGFRSVR
jgi:hypothetical protein